MKYLAFLLLILIACTGATKQEPLPRRVDENFEYIKIGRFMTPRYSLGKLIVDDCVYIIYSGFSSDAITHAGNCPNHNK